MNIPSRPVPGTPPSRRRRRSAAAVLLVAVSVLAAACSSGGDGTKVQTGRASDGEGAATGPVRDVLPDPGLELTGDTVVVRSDGGRAVRSIPDDADTIVIDASAEGADELDPGEVMLLTGVTVVRVVEIDEVGDELRITGAPVSIPEVIRNGELSWEEEPVDLGGARLSVWGDDAAGGERAGSAGGAAPGVPRPGGMIPGRAVPGGGVVPGGDDVPAEGVPSEDEVIDMWEDVNDVFGGGDGGDLFGLGEAAPVVPLGPADLRLIRSVEQAAAEEPPTTATSSSSTTTVPPKVEHSAKVKVDGIEYSFTYSRNDKDKVDVFKLSLESGSGKDVKEETASGRKIDVAEAKVKGSIETEVQLKDINHNGKLQVVDGDVRHFELGVPRLAGEINVDAKFQALSMVAHMTSDPLFDLPLSVEFPVLIGGIPFTFDVKVGVQVNLSMAMANNTLNGLAKITFDGDAGFQFAEGQLKVFGQRVQDVEDLLDSVKGLAEGPVGLVFTNELPKLSVSLGYKGIKAGVFLSNGYVVSFHILPMPAPCTATNVSYVLASGVTGDFFGLEVELGRKAITDKRWHFQIPQDQRCNTP